jgi:hypothetical protein
MQDTFFFAMPECFSGLYDTTEVVPFPALALAPTLISAFPVHCTKIGAKARFGRNLVKPPERVENLQVIVNTVNIFIENIAHLPYSISYHRSRWLEVLRR